MYRWATGVDQVSLVWMHGLHLARSRDNLYLAHGASVASMGLGARLSVSLDGSGTPSRLSVHAAA